VRIEWDRATVMIVKNVFLLFVDEEQLCVWRRKVLENGIKKEKLSISEQRIHQSSKDLIFCLRSIISQVLS